MCNEDLRNEIRIANVKQPIYVQLAQEKTPTQCKQRNGTKDNRTLPICKQGYFQLVLLIFLLLLRMGPPIMKKKVDA